jgi:CRP-like cAMP-binding protein
LFGPGHFNLPRIQFKTLLNGAFIRELSQGSAYADEGNRAHYLSILVSGKLEVSHFSKSQNRDVALNYVFPGEFIDSPQWVSRNSDTGNKFGVSIVASEESVFLMWPRENLYKIFSENPSLSACIDSVVGGDIAKKLFRVTETMEAKRANGEDSDDILVDVPMMSSIVPQNRRGDAYECMLPLRTPRTTFRAGIAPKQISGNENGAAQQQQTQVQFQVRGTSPSVLKLHDNDSNNNNEDRAEKQHSQYYDDFKTDTLQTSQHDAQVPQPTPPKSLSVHTNDTDGKHTAIELTEIDAPKMSPRRTTDKNKTPSHRIPESPSVSYIERAPSTRRGVRRQASIRAMSSAKPQLLTLPADASTAAIYSRLHALPSLVHRLYVRIKRHVEAIDELMSQHMLSQFDACRTDVRHVLKTLTKEMNQLASASPSKEHLNQQQELRSRANSISTLHADLATVIAEENLRFGVGDDDRGTSGAVEHTPEPSQTHGSSNMDEDSFSNNSAIPLQVGVLMNGSRFDMPGKSSGSDESAPVNGSKHSAFFSSGDDLDVDLEDSVSTTQPDQVQ